MKNGHSNTKHLAPWATPDESPWADRCHPEQGDDPRGSYQRDRDRIIHCASFRKLQHKTQVFVVHEGDYFRTRLNHSIEVTQIGRTLASMLDLMEPLVEAICLGHDLGHGPFGHAGESEIDGILKEYSTNKKRRLKWNANVHSLTLVEELEVQYPSFRGLNLTWATREGLARHKTKYDAPGKTGKYDKYYSPSLEAQVANVADVIAYGTHDVEDALHTPDILRVEELGEQKIDIWEKSWEKANDEFNEAHPGGQWSGVDREQLLIRRAHRHLIDCLIWDVVGETNRRLQQHNVTTLSQARDIWDPIVWFSEEVAPQVNCLLDFMMETVYRGPVVTRQNYRASHIIRELFEALLHNPRLLPLWVQPLVKRGSKRETLEVARFLAGLTDRGAADLYAELFEPTERMMGHRIV